MVSLFLRKKNDFVHGFQLYNSIQFATYLLCDPYSNLCDWSFERNPAAFQEVGPVSGRNLKLHPLGDVGGAGKMRQQEKRINKKNECAQAGFS